MLALARKNDNKRDFKTALSQKLHKRPGKLTAFVASLWRHFLFRPMFYSSIYPRSVSQLILSK